MMRKVLALAGRIWTKNKASNIMVMILAFLTFYVSMTLYNKFMGFYETSFYFEKTPLNNSLLFMGRESYLNEDGYAVNAPEPMKEFIRYAENSNIVKTVSNSFIGGATTNSGEWNMLNVYDEVTASYIKNCFTMDGKWLFEEEKQDGCYPIAVKNSETSKYKIGDKLNLTLKLIDDMKNIDSYIDVSVECVVVGIIYDSRPIWFNVGNYKSNFVDTVENVFDMGNSRDWVDFYFPYDENIMAGYSHNNDNVIVYFTDNATDKEIAEFHEHANEIGYAQLGKDIVGKSREEGDFQFNKGFFVFFSLAGLLLISIFCISFLNMKKVSKNFAVYYLNGCSVFKSAIIYFIYFIGLYTVSLGVYIGYSAIQHQVILNSNGVEYRAQMFENDVGVILTIWAIGLVVSAIVTAVPFAAMKNKSKIALAKEN